MVQGLEGLLQGPSQLRHPERVERPIEGLKLRRDGLLCRRVPAQCQYICISEGSMLEHLRGAHDSSRYGRKGRPSKRQQVQATRGWTITMDIGGMPEILPIPERVEVLLGATTR